jgi:hypothetical protein
MQDLPVLYATRTTIISLHTSIVSSATSRPIRAQQIRIMLPDIRKHVIRTSVIQPQHGQHLHLITMHSFLEFIRVSIRGNGRHASNAIKFQQIYQILHARRAVTRKHRPIATIKDKQVMSMQVRIAIAAIDRYR